MKVHQLISRLCLMPPDSEVEIELIGDSDGSPRDKNGVYVGEVRSVRFEADETITINQRLE